MSIPRRIIEKSLPDKGFVRENDHDHRYFYHEYNGRRTGAYTYTSHGSKGYKDYGDELLKRMRVPLHLDYLREVKNLCLCPMDGNDYNQILRRKGLINSTINNR